MTEYLWASPAGTYRVPEGWKAEFLREFPTYRVRWSLKKGNWQIEQRIGSGAIPPLRIDPFDDSLIRACDGYWLVMETSPGSRITCPGFIQFNSGVREVCGASLRIPPYRSGEVGCPACRSKGRDGRFQASYWPFTSRLLERLRYSDPLRGGITRQRSDADLSNAALIRDAERKQSDSVTSLDAVDYRWISGIASSSGRARHTISDKDLT